MMARFGFDVDTDTDYSDEFSLIADGWYAARIDAAAIKQTRTGGEMLEVKFQITDGPSQNRVVFWNANISNQSKAAEEIGRKQLAILARAIGLQNPSDSDQLIGGECRIKIATKPETEQYRARNEVKDFRSFGESQTAAPERAAPARPSAPARSSPPWPTKR